MKQGYTHITIVLDKSGSMAHLRKDMVGSFNEFIKGQQETPGEATFSLFLFDTYINPLFDFVPLSKIEPITYSQYAPGGGTALLDAIGVAILDTGGKLSALKEEDRPENVLFVIMTDGEENSSRDFDNAKIAEMIKHQTEAYSWVFSFIGANQDSFAQARKYNIPQGNTVNFKASGAGAQAVTMGLGQTMSSYRSSSEEERKSMSGILMDEWEKNEDGTLKVDKDNKPIKKAHATISKKGKK